MQEEEEEEEEEGGARADRFCIFVRKLSMSPRVSLFVFVSRDRRSRRARHARLLVGARKVNDEAYCRIADGRRRRVSGVAMG